MMMMILMMQMKMTMMTMMMTKVLRRIAHLTSRCSLASPGSRLVHAEQLLESLKKIIMVMTMMIVMMMMISTQSNFLKA